MPKLVCGIFGCWCLFAFSWVIFVFIGVTGANYLWLIVVF